MLGKRPPSEFRLAPETVNFPAGPSWATKPGPAATKPGPPQRRGHWLGLGTVTDSRGGQQVPLCSQCWER